MDTMIAVVFDTETQAYDAVAAIRELHQDGSIELYSGAVIVKDARGKLHMRDSEGEWPIGMIVGASIGAVVGALGGVPGAAAGSALGMVAGMPADVYNLGVGSDFVKEVGERLAARKCAVVAEISEGWTTPLNTRMQELGGRVVRQSRARVEEDQFDG